MNLLHENIKAFRIRKGISRKELAEQLSISYAALSKYETGERVPDITLVQHIAHALGVSLNELLGEADGMLTLNDVAADRSPHQRYRELNKKFLTLPYSRQRIVMELIEELSK